MTNFLSSPEPPPSLDAQPLRQAVERSRRAYARLLRGARGWDRLILTAASEPQADGYREELADRRSRGLLPPHVTLDVIADPPGERVGSGGATFHVLRRLGVTPGERVLLLHCGGESRRLPAYGPSGKLFVPLPCPRPDRRASTVFDEILVSLSPLAARMPPGWLIASADVLLLFHAAGVTPRSGAVTGLGFAVDAQTAQGHGIYVPRRDGSVAAFLQKPTMADLWAAKALRPDGAAIVDTGVFIFPEAVMARLQALSASAAGERPSDLYQDWVLPMVPSQSEADYRASGDPAVREALWAALRDVPLCVRVPEPSRFVHLGTTAQWRETLLEDEVTAHALGFELPFRSSIDGAETNGSAILNSHLTGDTDAANATGSLVIRTGAVLESCRLSGPVRIGEGAVAVGVTAETPAGFRLPPGYTFDQLPVRREGGSPGWVTRVYPVLMDPKATGDAVQLFGEAASEWMKRHGLAPADLWEGDPASRSLWNARLFPVGETPEESLERARWLLACAEHAAAREQAKSDEQTIGSPQDPASPPDADAWKTASRLSFEACGAAVDRGRWRERRDEIVKEALRSRARLSIEREADIRTWLLSTEDLRDLLETLKPDLKGENGALRAARANWLMADLIAAAGRPSSGRTNPVPSDGSDEDSARESAVNLTRLSPGPFEGAAFLQIRLAVDSGVSSPVESPRLALATGEEVFADAPVRLDIGGGWSDTPPYSLEHGGSVLNVAALLEGERPVRVWVRPLPEPVLTFRALDLDAELTVSERSEALRYSDPRDPFALHKGGVALMQIVTPDGGPLKRQLERFGGGLEVTTESAVPKGSGLGTSSILGGVLLAALGRALGVELSADDLFHQVLALEQRLTIGGGWQDQVGGLVGGWKITRTKPGVHQVPHLERLSLSSETGRALEDRMFLMYSGYTRLARGILRNMVGRYLSRDAETLGVLHGMRALVDEMSAALRSGDLDSLGTAMDRTNREIAAIDPQSWPPHLVHIVDAVSAHLTGAKPAGAGGGGFMMFVAKSREDRQRAEEILNRLDLPPGARTYPLEVAEEGLRVTIRPRSLKRPLELQR